MTRYTISLLLAFAAATLPAGAIDFASQEAGSLQGAFGEPANVLVLTVSGPIDASDLFFIDKQMTSLTALDLSQAEIVAYQGKVLRGQTGYPAATIPAGTFAGAGFTSVSLPEQTSLTIGDGAFAGSALTAVSIGSNVADMGTGAFSGCQALKQATVSTTAVGAHAFANSPALASVQLTGTTSVGASAFDLCSALGSISGTNTLVSIGDEAFAGCKELKSFAFGKELKSIGTSAFAQSGLESANLSECTKLESIGAMSFSGAKNLTSVELPGGLSAVGDGAFFDCTALTHIALPEGLSEIPAYAFKGDASLSDGNIIASGVASVGKYAMKDMTGIEELVLPSTLESLGDGAMEGMTGLKKIDAQNLNTVPTLGKDVWKGVEQSEVELHLTNVQSEEFGEAEQWKEFKFMVATGTEQAGPEVATTRVEGRFAGSELQIRATGAEIAKVDLYHSSGVLALSRNYNEPESSVNIPTESIQGQIFIVECSLTDGSHAALKLLRH